MTIKQKIGAAIATGALLAATLLPGAAFAGNNTASCTISQNGVNSNNTCTVKIIKVKIQTQSNSAWVSNTVVGVIGTGGNSVDGNTGGSNSLTTGSASVNVTINNTLNQNNM